MEGRAKKTSGYCTHPWRRERERKQRITNNAIDKAMAFIAVEKKVYRFKKTYHRTFWGMRVETGGKFVGVKEKTSKLVYSQPQQQQQAKQTQGWPTQEKGGWIDADKLYDYLLNHAKNTSVEVAAYELKRGKEDTKYFVLPWNRNTKTSSVLPMATLNKYVPGYSYKDITAVFHTHPSSSPPSTADKAYSDKYNIPIYSIGANGISYLYLGGTTSVIDLSLYFGF